VKNSKFWIAVLVSGLVMNVVDFVGQGMIMTNMYYSKHADFFYGTTNPLWFVIADFVTIFVLAIVYDRVAASFSGGWKGGAVFGLYAGVLVNFPTWIILHLFITGFSYKYAWFSTIYGIVWTAIAAAIIGAMTSKPTDAPLNA